jgi:argininosuccinate lyase
MNIENFVIDKVGNTKGGQLNLAKSRNDQVSAAIRMILREYILEIISSANKLNRQFLEKCKEHINTVMPGYTHLQQAQPVTLALHLLAHQDALSRDIERLTESYPRINSSPMGACALATTNMEIDRKMVSELLGFGSIIENSIDAVSSRDSIIELVFDLSSIMVNLSRFAEELILWSTQEFNIVEIPDEFSSTSSIMPQKKNPVVLEIIRAKASNVIGDLFTSLSMMKSLPLSYNLDLQEITPHVWDACEITTSSLMVLKNMMEKIKFNTKKIAELLQNDKLMATELADSLVKEHKIPFRTAHKIVAILVRKSLETKRTLSKTLIDDFEDIFKDVVKRTPPKTIDPKILDPYDSINMKTVIGGPNPKQVSKMIENRLKNIDNNDFLIMKKNEALKSSDLLLDKEIQSVKEVTKK